MGILKVGDLVPEFQAEAVSSGEISNKKLKGKWSIIYFYPKDNTPGCSLEAIDFSSYREKFDELGVVVFGVSKDSLKSHQNFIEKKELKIELISDEEIDMIEKFGVWQLKKNYGKEYMGIVRSTFIISPELKIEEVWENVKVKGHVENVYTKIKELVKK